MESVWDLILVHVYLWVRGNVNDFAYFLEQFVVGYEFVKLQSPVSHRSEVVWKAPLMGILKFNVDGASKGNPGQSGIGGVL